MDRPQGGCIRQVNLLGAHQSHAHWHRTLTGAQLTAEFIIQPLAVFDKVGVTVLVTGTGDQRSAFLSEGRSPVRLRSDVGHGVLIHKAVAGMAPWAGWEAM